MHGEERMMLYGLINTKEEAELILKRLMKEGYLLKPFSEDEIKNYLIELQSARSHRVLLGPVDTPLEIELFLSILRKANVLSKSFDKPDLTKSFINNLKNEGLISDSFTRSSIEYHPGRDKPDLQ